MKAKWAVACAVPIFGVLFALGSGCSGTRSQVKEFHRMDVGEGPGDVLTHLINLQKESGDQQIVAHSPPSAQGEGSGVPPVPSDYPPGVSPGGLSMSKDTVAMHEVMPAVPPLGNPPVLVQSDEKSAQSSSMDSVPPASAELRSPSPAKPVRNMPSPPIAAEESPVPAQSRVPLAATVSSGQTRTEVERAPDPIPPVSHHMTFKREGTSQSASREVPSSPPPSPASAAGQITAWEKGKATGIAGGLKYRIGPEDVLHIDVWGNVELSGDVTVRPDGKISMALIQDVQAEGLTAGELSDVIQRKLMVFIKNPEVAVIVTQINAPKVFVIGYVTKPGSYPLRGDMTVLQALSLAGGFTPFASPKNIQVVSVGTGGQETRMFNYYDMIGKEGEGKYFLKPGDTIVVP